MTLEQVKLIAGAAVAETSATPDASQRTHQTLVRLAQDRAPLQAYDNYDLTGPTTRVLPNTDLQGCTDSCRADSTCRSFSYDKWERRCSLKQHMGLLRFDPQAISGIPLTVSRPPMANDPIVMECQRGKTFADTPLKTVVDTAFEQCQKSCEDDKNCVGFTHFEIGNGCNLFSTADQPTRHKTVITGVKHQLPSGSAISDAATCSSLARSSNDQIADKGPREEPARAKVSLNEHETAIYEAARGDVTKLREYLKSCRHHAFRRQHLPPDWY